MFIFLFFVDYYYSLGQFVLSWGSGSSYLREVLIVLYLIDAQVQDDIDDNHTLFSDAAFTATPVAAASCYLSYPQNPAARPATALPL